MKEPQTRAEWELLDALHGMAVQYSIDRDGVFDHHFVSAGELCEVALLDYGLLKIVHPSPPCGFARLYRLPSRESRSVLDDERYSALLEKWRVR